MTEPSAQAALFAALATAIQETRAVNKDAQGQGYLYARAENVMREADRVLTPNGITVCPIGARIVVSGQSEGKNGSRTIFSLECRFLVAHVAGGSFVGEMTIAVGTNLNATPPQATSSAYTCCERDFYRALLRMPRGPDDDVEHPKNNRSERDDEPRPPATPSVPIPTTRKATKVLATIAKVATVEQYETVVARWSDAIAHRGAPLDDGGTDDCGYSDADVAEVQRALAAARERVGIR